MRAHLEVLIHVCREELALVDARRNRLIEEIQDYELMLKWDADSERSRGDFKPVERWLGNISSTWTAILTRLADYQRFRADDVVLVSRDLCREHSAIKEQTPGNARYQLAAYAKKGIVQRRGGGNYQISEKSRAALSLIAAERSKRLPSTQVLHQKKFGPELAALAQERRATPANPAPAGRNTRGGDVKCGGATTS